MKSVAYDKLTDCYVFMCLILHEIRMIIILQK